MKSDARDLEYGISFDTKEMPGRIVAVAVKLSKIFMGPKDSVRVDLVDHPLYPKLEEYVLANPTKQSL
jgi:hypothetical protein